MTTTITILGGLGLFLYGMKIMSEALQNTAGERMKNALWRVTNNRVKGVLTGMSITTVIQSSSATTVMLVGFVNAGLIDLIQATGIVFGANIGTTVTGWIVAIVGFKFKINTLALPAIGIGFFMRFLNRERVTYWGDFLLGFGMLFLGLGIMSDSVRDLRDHPVIMNFMTTYRASDIPSTMMVILVGTLVTMLIQSSSATMAMTMAMAVNGLIDFPTAAALILGENIGTTITANLAAIGASVAAKRTARVHFLFNFIGVLWVLALFKPVFIPLVDRVVPGNPVEPSFIADHMAAFHTIFNLLNCLIFLPFVRVLANLAELMVPVKAKDEQKEFHLKYISTAMLSTPSIHLNQARMEIERMMIMVSDMFTRVMELFDSPLDKMGKRVEEILTQEDHIDLLEKEISTFLVRVSQNSQSKEQSQEISIMLQRVNELESIGDQCEVLLRLIRRKYDEKLIFSDTANNQIRDISGKVREFLNLISADIATIEKHNIIPQANVLENRINELRWELRKDHIQRLNDGICDVAPGLLFIDMLTAFEKIGDFAYNIAEGIAGLRVF